MIKESSQEDLITKIQRFQFIDKMLNESLPSISIALLGVINIANGIACIGIQIISIIFEASLFYIAPG